MSDKRINADFSQAVAIDTHSLPWIPSPLVGVDRRMLDRIGGEVARATSIVRYAPNSHFDEHRHGLGEEFLVLEGVFSDEHGDFPAGAYVRNPPGTKHTPRSVMGCTIFVKLRQFDPQDLIPVHQNLLNDTYNAQWAPGVEVMHLHHFEHERVFALRFAAGSNLPAQQAHDGEELLVIEGQIQDQNGLHNAGAWQRNPPGKSMQRSSEKGAIVYLKTGHLHER